MMGSCTTIPPKPRILFVDDEPQMLASIEAVLRKDRSRWDMVFVSNGAAALDELRRNHCNVVVSDMRMPGMDGERLLTQTSTDHPTTGRILLTGHAEPDTLRRVLPLLHELLIKPCGAARLREAIARAIDMR